MSEFMKKPCTSCPYRTDVKPFLRPERGEELAYLAQNPYNNFYCHKTLGEDEDEGDTCVDAESKVCAGFLTLQHNENGSCGYKDFQPSKNVYDSADEMTFAYAEEGS